MTGQWKSLYPNKQIALWLNPNRHREITIEFPQGLYAQPDELPAGLLENVSANAFIEA